MYAGRIWRRHIPLLLKRLRQPVQDTFHNTGQYRTHHIIQVATGHLTQYRSLQDTLGGDSASCFSWLVFQDLFDYMLEESHLWILGRDVKEANSVRSTFMSCWRLKRKTDFHLSLFWDVLGFIMKHEIQ